MGTISVSLPSDGQTIDAADYNVPINTIVAAINGNIDSNNILAGGVVPNSLTSGTGTTWAWQTFTPSLTNWTIGSGGSAATTAKYIQIGKTVFVKLKSVLGTSGQSVSGEPTFNLPVTASANFGAFDQVGTVWMLAGGAGFTGYVRLTSTTAAKIVPMVSSGTYVSDGTITASVPGVWAAGEYFTTQFYYESA